MLYRNGKMFRTVISTEYNEWKNPLGKSVISRERSDSRYPIKKQPNV